MSFEDTADHCNSGVCLPDRYHGSKPAEDPGLTVFWLSPKADEANRGTRTGMYEM
jgi:hypothetical protein